MPRYYVNKNRQTTGEHEVHKDGPCPTPAEPQNRDDLGYFTTCREALVAAMAKGYQPVDGCKWCVPECHTR
jgi:hypothetical protein